MHEIASIYAAEMIKMLLHVHALTNMHRASGNDEHRKAAADWIESLERQLSSLKRELTRTQEQVG